MPLGRFGGDESDDEEEARLLLNTMEEGFDDMMKSGAVATFTLPETTPDPFHDAEADDAEADAANDVDAFVPDADDNADGTPLINTADADDDANFTPLMDSDADDMELAPLTGGGNDRDDRGRDDRVLQKQRSGMITLVPQWILKLFGMGPGNPHAAGVVRRRRKRSNYDDVDFERNYDICNCHRIGRYLTKAVLTVIVAVAVTIVAALVADFVAVEAIDVRGRLGRYWGVVGTNDAGGTDGEVMENIDDFYYPAADGRGNGGTGEMIRGSANRGDPDEDDLFLNIMEDDVTDQDDSIRSSQGLPVVRTIVVLGERHCGVDWLVSRLEQLYPNLEVRSGFAPVHNPAHSQGSDGIGSRPGIWFQDADGKVKSEGHREQAIRRGAEGFLEDHLSDEDDDFADRDLDHGRLLDEWGILVVAVFLNPFDWIEMMRLDPMHAPAHVNMKWRNFLEKPWSPGLPRGTEKNTPARKKTGNGGSEEFDDFMYDDFLLFASGGSLNDDWENGDPLPFDDDTEKASGSNDDYFSDAGDFVGLTCQLSFSPERVLPCQHDHLPSDDDIITYKHGVTSRVIDNDEKTPVYELRADGSGIPYVNILKLRADKIRYAAMESLFHRKGVRALITVRYEELVGPYTPGGAGEDHDWSATTAAATDLPGIVGVADRIRERTGLVPAEDSGWREPRNLNPFWADPVGCPGNVCPPSITKMRNDVEYIRYVNNHVDWSAEQLLGFQKRAVPKVSVETIVVLGERHSGAAWLANRLARIFPHIEVKTDLSGRPGKWFQKERSSSLKPTLVISMFLNPYDWVESMRQNPINAPAHINMQWSKFVNTPWTRKRSNLDEDLTDAEAEKANCAFGFSFHEVVPCLTQRDTSSEAFPLYELRQSESGGGESSYPSILELRSDKIRNFLDVSTYEGVVDLIPLRYEDLVWDDGSSLPFPGIAGVLELIRDRTTLVPDAAADWITDKDGYFKAAPVGSGRAGLDASYVEWMGNHVQWETERLIGYEKWQQ